MMMLVKTHIDGFCVMTTLPVVHRLSDRCFVCVLSLGRRTTCDRIPMRLVRYLSFVNVFCRTMEEKSVDTLEIEFLPEKEWKGYLLPLDYESRECYDVRIDEERDMTVSFVRTALATPFVHRDSECAFPARLYEDYYEKAEAYGIRK